MTRQETPEKDYQSTQLEWPIRSRDFEVLAVNPLDDDYRLYAVAGVFQDNEIWPEYHAEADGCGRERTVVPIPAIFMPESESAEPGVYVVEFSRVSSLSGRVPVGVTTPTGLRTAYTVEHIAKLQLLIGVPGLPETRCPLPIRLIAIPGLGELLSRLVPPSPKSVLRFASFVGEKATLAAHPDLVDLMVATGRDPIAAASARAEIRVLVSPFALLSPSGFRRHSRVRPDELRQLGMPTLVVWGEQDPLGSVSVAQAVTELIPHARLKVLPTGHAPWLGQPAQTAATVAVFVR